MYVLGAAAKGYIASSVPRRQAFSRGHVQKHHGPDTGGGVLHFRYFGHAHGERKICHRDVVGNDVHDVTYNAIVFWELVFWMI